MTSANSMHEAGHSKLWDNIKCTNIRVIGVLEGKEKKKGAEKIFEDIIVENFPNTGKEIVNQVQEVQSHAGESQEKLVETHTNQANRD